MNRRSVAFLTVASPPGLPQGVADYSKALAAAVASSEFDVLVWVQRIWGLRPVQGRTDDFISVWRPGLLAGPDVLRRISLTHPDLLHVQFEFGIYGGALGLASMLCGLGVARLVLGQRIIVTLHQVPASRDLTSAWLRRSGIRLPSWAGRGAIGSVISILGRTSDCLVVHADLFRDRLQTEWSVRSTPVVIPHGVASDNYGSATPEHLPDERRLLLFGYLKWYKGAEIAIEAFRLLAREFSDWTLMIAGPSTSEAYRHSLLRLARPLGSRVAFLGPVDEEQIAHLFRGSIVLLPYRTLFSASGPLAQAIGYRTPFVISEELRPLCPTWPYCASPDPADWARVLTPLMRDDAVRAAARRLVAALATELDWSVIADQTRAVYRAMLS